jgi:hypothetical protein
MSNKNYHQKDQKSFQKSDQKDSFFYTFHRKFGKGSSEKPFFRKDE